MGYPECASAPPSLPQYGQIPQLFGGSYYYHSGMHVHPIYSQAATGYPQAGAYGLQHTTDAGVPSPYGCGNGAVSSGIVSMLEGLRAAGVLQQEIPPPPPLPPEIEDQSLPLPPLPPDSGF